MRIISWNIQRQDKCWSVLLDDPTVDIALVQEAVAPPKTVSWSTPEATAPWTIQSPRRSFCTGITGFNGNFEVNPIPTQQIGLDGEDALGD